ncbi:MAG TPA: alpha/beta hydrolase [Acidimicrobiales bacterium]|nr:alpha/beta hydrolase [Acidimicrobiales bacterium]
MLASTDRGSGPPVVLLHGQPGSGSSWDPVTALLEPDFRVLAPDRVGYGATTGEARGLAGNAEVVEEFIRTRGASPATVVAHSWSGGVAVLLADRCPGLVRSLVLVGAACTPDSLNALDRWLNVPVLGDALTVVGLVGIGEVLPRLRRLARHAPARLRDELASALPDPGVLGGGRGALGRHKRTFMIEQRALVEELPSVTAALGRLELPVSVVQGQWDLVVPPRAGVSLSKAVRGAELVLLPRAGHFVSRDDPRSLADVIRRSALR